MKFKNKAILSILVLLLVISISSAGYAQINEGSVQNNIEQSGVAIDNTTVNETIKIDSKDNITIEEKGALDKSMVSQPNEEPKTNKTLSGRAVIVDLASEKLEYDQQTDTFTATGAAKVVVSEQNAELVADKIIYHQGEQYLTAEGSVKIVKDGKTISGNYAKIDLTKESALISNPSAVVSKIKMSAKEAVLYPEYIELKQGSAVVEQEGMDVKLTSGIYKPEELMRSVPGQESIIPDNPENKKPSYRIVAKEIELDRSKKSRNLVIKNAKIYVGKLRVAAIPRLTLTIGENANQIEAMLPEVGFNKNIGGIYFGPSLTLNLPKNSTLRVSPVFSAFGRDSDIGGGVVSHFRSSINKTDIAYTTTGNRLVVRGEQKVYKDTTKIKYVVNEYPDEGFMGTGLYRPLYLVELVDERKIGKLLNHNIFTRASGGIARDVNDGIATGRVQLQGNIISDKPLLHFKDFVALRLQSQFNLAAYGTGDGYAVVRGGPRVDWNLWRLRLTTSYMQAGVWGETPFVFDEFIRGKSNLILAGDFRVSKFLSIGNIRSLNLSKDGAEPQLTTENQVYARIGPEDFKFRVGYDIERKRSIFGLDLFLGSGRSALNFDSMKILHPEMDIR